MDASLNQQDADADLIGVNTSDLTVDVDAVSQWFGDVQALTNLSIKVPTGSITTLLGPNGAGKTTAIRMITGALEPGQGSVSVFGLDPAGPEGEEVRRRCGVFSAKPSLYDRLDGWDNLRYAAELYGLGRNADARISEAANTFGIDAALDQQVGGYSTGMKTRLALARAILHEPDLLLLDEPTSGLDPESAVSVLSLIRDMTAGGRTVLLCTHLLLEAEGLADEIVIMEHGTSLVAGAPAELSRHFWPSPQVSIGTADGAHLETLEGAPGVLSVALSNDRALLEVEDVEIVPELVRSLVNAGAAITTVAPFNPNLEDLYFAVRKGRDPQHQPPPPATDDRRSHVAAAAAPASRRKGQEAR